MLSVCYVQRKAYCKIRWQNGNVTKKNRFLTIASEYLAGTKQKEEDEILPTSDNKVEISDDNVGHRFCAVKGKERGRSELPQKSSREPFSRTKKPRRKSVNLKDRDQLGKRNGEERDPRELLRHRSTRIRELSMKKSQKFAILFTISKIFFSRVLFSSHIIRNPRFVRNRRIRVLSRNKKNIKTETRHFARDYFPCHRLSCQAEIASPSGRAREARGWEEARSGKKEERASDRLAWAILGCDSRYRTCSNPARAKTHYAPLRVLFAPLSSGARYSSQAGANQQVTREAALRAAGGLTLAFFVAIRVA